MDKNKGMLVIIMVMLGIVIAALVAAVIFVLTVLPTLGAGDDDAPQVAIHDVSLQDIRQFTLGSDIITNLLPSPTGGRSHVRMTVALGINNTDPDAADEFITMLADREVIVASIVTEHLRRTTAESLQRIDGLSIFADQLRDALQDQFQSQMIVNVFLLSLET